MRRCFSARMIPALLAIFLGGCGASSFDEKYEEAESELESEMVDKQTELETQIDEELGTASEQE